MQHRGNLRCEPCPSPNCRKCSFVSSEISPRLASGQHGCRCAYPKAPVAGLRSLSTTGPVELANPAFLDFLKRSRVEVLKPFPAAVHYGDKVRVLENPQGWGSDKWRSFAALFITMQPVSRSFTGLRIEAAQLPFMEPAKETVERWEMKVFVMRRRRAGDRFPPHVISRQERRPFRARGQRWPRRGGQAVPREGCVG